MADGSKAFVKANVTQSTLNRIELDTMVFATPQGKVFKSLSLPRSKGGPVPSPSEILSVLKIPALSASAKIGPAGIHGFIRVSTGLTLVSVRPILKTDESGPRRGWLVFGRTFGQRELTALRDLTGLDISVAPLDDPSIAADRNLQRIAHLATLADMVEPLDQKTVAGYSVLKDLQGRPGLLISMRKPRAIYQQGLDSIGSLRNLILFAGLVFGLVTMFVVERFALSRLVRLSAEVAAIGDLSINDQVGISGHDEVSWLATKINEMLTKLHESEERLHCYNANLEQTVQDRTQEIEHQAFHDKLTGLPNRALFTDRIGAALAKAQRSKLATAAFFIDLDNFKLINDSLGHSVGDALLIAVAQRLKNAIRPGDTVARLGGDEFTVILEDLNDKSEATKVAETILQNLRAPFSLDGVEAFANASIGIAFTADANTEVDHLMKNADTAMYRAKANGKSNFVVYDEGMNDHAVERLEIETGLRKAVINGEISIQYQPLIDLETNAMKGAEALARWNHPTKGAITPGRFIPIAEETGIIVPLGYWILEEACRQTAEWREQFDLEAFTISINLSGKQLQRDDVVDRVAEILYKTGLAPHALKLEITESVLMSDRAAVVEKMRLLKELGIKLALDDFGTGYSSLSTLGSFPVDTLKIDQSFISRLGEEEQAVSIVQAIIALSRSMKMDVTGEGVETPLQRQMTTDLGCHTGQGYLFDRPLSPEDLRERLHQNAGNRKNEPKMAA